MITLINPPFISKKSLYLNYYKEGPYPHPGLAYLAGYLKKAGIRIRVIDAKFHKMNSNEVIKNLKKINPKIIGISSNTTEIDNVQKLISQIKKTLPKTFIILGGPHASALPLNTLEDNKDLDAIAIGEGEHILEKLALSKDLCSSLNTIKGIAYRDKEDHIRKTPGQSYGKDAYDYGTALFSSWPKAKLYHVLTYRGCPFSCSFCFRTIGKQVRLRKVEDVLADLEYVASNSLTGLVDFSDATFGLPKKHTIDIMEHMIQSGLAKRLKWSCSTRANIIDKDFLILMKKAGCFNIAFGIESGSDKILKASGKNISKKQCIKVIKEAKSIGLETVGLYIFGHINEEKKDIEKTVRMIYKLNTNDIAIGIMSPWPGTKVYQLAEKNKDGYKLLNKNYSHYEKYFGSSLAFDNFSLTYLELIRIKAYLYFYIKNRRFKGLFKFIYSYRSHIFNKGMHLITQLYKISFIKKT